MTLFEITTDALRLVWSGPDNPPAVPADPSRRPFGLRVTRLDDGPPARMRRSESARHLFEETAYTLFARGGDGRVPGVRHIDPVLIGALQRPAPDTLHGPVNFGGQVGRSTFVITLDGVPHLRFDVEVMPSKLDYREDYRALVEDVARIADSLALQHVAAAFHEGSAGEGRGGAATEVALLDALADTLDHALRRAFRQPLRRLVRAEGVEALHRIRRPDAALVRRLARRAAEGDTLVAPTSGWTLDTPEHRWIAARLAALDARLTRRLERPARTPRQEAARALVARLRQRVAAWREAAPLRGVSPATAAPAPTLRLMRTPGYREAAQALETLHRRFSLDAGALPFRLRDLHRLYEYACLLWIAEGLADATGQTLDATALVEPDAAGLDLKLRTGAQRLVFPLPGGTATLRYVPRLAASGALLSQKPDFLLTVRHAGAAPRRYVLDAKYRLEATPQAVARYGIPGPPSRALGALHRYRDAIVEREAGKIERRVVEAVVLYPWRDDGRYAASPLARSIEEMGVGAIPVLPGATAHLHAWLRRVLNAR